VYPNGDVCISILHEPGEDSTNPQETAAMRWNPIHTVETIVVSVISMLSDPTDESPANLDAAVLSSALNVSLGSHEKRRTQSSMCGKVAYRLTLTLTDLCSLPDRLQKEFREEYATFKKKAARCVARSLEGE
jgi:hypothetical protein